MVSVNSAKGAKVSGKKIKGVPDVTDYIADFVVPNTNTAPVSEDTIRRELIKYECGSGGLVCDERENKKVPFSIEQSSLDALFDPCDTKSIPEIAKYCGKSERWVKDKIKNDPKFPVYVLFENRVFSTQESLSSYMLNYCEKPGNHKPLRRDIKRWTIQ